MDDLFRSYWWLLFPVGFFIFGAWDRWLIYQRSRDHLELLRTYTEQGKEPPPELLRTVREAEAQDEEELYAMRPGRRHRYYRRMYRHGPYWAWRSAFVTGGVALGFWLAAEYGDIPGTVAPFHLVAIILTCVAGANLAVAILSTVFRDR